MTSFNQIPLNMLTPGQYVEFDASKATTGLPKPRNRTLLFGQKLSTGSKANNILIKVNTAAEAQEFFGRGSMLARMVDAYRKIDKNRDLYCIALNDAAGTSATATITVGTAPTQNGTIELLVAGQYLSIPVATTDTVTTIATAIAAAVNATADMPVTATSALGVVTLTAKHKGTCGVYDIRDTYTDGKSLPVGLTLTYTAFTGGATDPDVQQVYTALGAEEFKTHVTPYIDATSLGIIKTNIAAAIDGVVQMDTYFVGASTNTLSANTTLGSNHNCEFGTILGQKGFLNPSYEVAAAYAAAIAISEDEDPSLPFTGLPLTGILPPKTSDRHTRQERNYLLAAGISTTKVDVNNVVIIDRVISLYKTNPQGFADTAYQDLNVILTLYYLRWSLRYRIATKFPRFKLGRDGYSYPKGVPVVTPSAIKAEIIAQYVQWADAAYVDGAMLNDFIAGTTVEIAANDNNRINAYLPPDLINQFLVFAAQIGFRR